MDDVNRSDYQDRKGVDTHCPSCGRAIRVNKKGLLYRHHMSWYYSHGEECAGSGGLPLEAKAGNAEKVRKLLTT